MPENVYIHQLTLGQLEGEVLRKLWITFDEGTDGVPPASAFSSRLPQSRVRRKINQACAEIAARTKAIQGWFILPLKATYGQYAVPGNVFDIASPVYYFTSSTAYDELPVYSEAELDDQRPGWRTTTGSMPEFAYSGLSRGTQRYIGFTPTPTTSATAVTLDSTVLERDGPYGPAEGVEGTATSGSGATAMVDASAQNFVELGVVPGMVILNVSDGSKGTITTITTTATSYDTINCSGGLTGGSANTWTLADEFRVIGGSYGGFIEIGDTEASFLVGKYSGDIPFPKITMASGNVLFKAYLRPVLLVTKNQFPELPPELHPTVGELAAGYLAGEYPVDTAEYKQSEMYLAKANQAVVLASSYLADQYRGGDKFLWSQRK
jgi:hypothetical protein